jgi:5'-AMP-activated protein kinase catalytic alpha subunit
LYEIIDDPSLNKLYIITEVVKNGTLGERLAKRMLSTEEVRKHFRDLISALEYCHEIAGVIHRDIKPENILIDENDRVKLADFGVSFIMENGCDEITTKAGSNYFFSPEACKGSKYRGKGSDIWATGVTLYYMCMRQYPFVSSNFPDLYYKI